MRQGLDFGAEPVKFDMSSAVEVKEDSNVVFDARDGATYSLPQGLNYQETRFLIDTTRKPKTNYFAMQDVGPLEATVKAVKKFAFVDVPGAAGALAKESADVAEIRQTPGVVGGELVDAAKTSLKYPPYALKTILYDLPSQAISGLVNAVGPERVRDWGNSVQERTRRYMAENNVERPPDGYGISSGVFDVVSGVSSLGVSLGLTVVTRNPAAATAFFGAFQKGQIYEEATQSGKSPAEASKLSSVAGSLEAGLEFVGIGSFMKSLGRSGVVSRLAEGFVTESAQEFLQQGAEEALTQGSGVRPMDIKGGVQNALYSGFLGGLVGGGAAAVIGGHTRKAAKEEGFSDTQAERLAKYAEDNADVLASAVEEVIQADTAPLSENTTRTAEAMAVFKKFMAGQPIVNEDALSEADLRQHKADVAEIQSVIQDYATDGIREDWMRKATAAGIDTAKAEASSDLLVGRALAASKALGVTPREWYDALKLDVRGDPNTLNMQEIAQTDAEYFASEEFQRGLPPEELNQEGKSTQIDTPEFKEWFGNSKVVDESGQPLIVYHTGTMNDVYDITKSRSYSGTPDYELPGIYLTANKEESSDYGTPEQTKDLYVSIQKPYTGDLFNLHKKFGSWRKALDYLISQGFDGVLNYDDLGEIIAFSPNQIKSATKNRGTFDSNDPNIYHQTKRGSVQFRPDGSKLISLFKGADQSTLFHELGHVFLRDVQSVASVTRSEQVRQDWQTIKDWLGVDGETMTRQQEETFARGFEAYLREGVAPTSMLEKAFERFRQWLTQVYRSLKDLNVEISDDMRRVFDRMLTGGEEAGKADAKPAFVQQSELAQKEFSAQEYEKVRKIPKESAFRRNVGAAMRDFSGIIDDIFIPVSTRLGRIDAKLRDSVRRFSFNIGFHGNQDAKIVKPFLDGIRKIPVEDYRELDLELKNVDSERVDFIIRKHGLLKEYKAVRELLDKLYDEAREAGLQVNFIEEYWPRAVNREMADEFVTQMKGTSAWSGIEEAIRKSGAVSQEEQAEVANQYLRGYGYDKIGLARPDILKKRQDATKKRTIAFIDANMNRFYEDSMQALAEYLSGMRRTIEVRKFLGQSSVDHVAAEQAVVDAKDRLETITKDWDAQIAAARNDVKRKELEGRKAAQIAKQQEKIDQAKQDYLDTTSPDMAKSIGAYVLKLAKEGVVTHANEKDLKKIIQAIVEPKGVGRFISALKGSAYIYTMGDVSSAITQLGDLAFSMVDNGVLETLSGAARSAVGKSAITKEDIGIQHIAEEFSDKGLINQAVTATFKAVGLDYLDKIGKEAYLNAAYERLKKEASSGALDDTLERVFGEDADRVKKELMDGVRSEDVFFLLFCELSDVQPASFSEMPVGYLRSGNLRSLYMLKTYTVKLLDVYRTRIFDLYKTDKASAVQNLVKLAAILMIMGMGTDALKDLMFGRKIHISDLVVDNLIKLTGGTKYQIYKSKEEGVANALIETIFMPSFLSPINDLSRDIIKTVNDPEKHPIKDWQSIGRLPLFGRLYYWWVGGGVKKKQLAEAKKKREQSFADRKSR